MVSQQPWVSTAPEHAPEAPELESGLIRLLVVDQDEVAGARLSAQLGLHNYIVSTIKSPAEAETWLANRPADALVLFTGGSQQLATEGARLLREATDLPLIVVGSDGAAEDRVGAFDRGAEDFLTAPVVPSALDRRVRVLVRRDRLRRRSDELTGPAGVVMRVRSHEAFVGPTRLALTPKEFAVFEVLLGRRGEVVVPDDLAQLIWGHGTMGSRNFVEAHISRLRAKLRRAGAEGVIKTVRGVGYTIR